MRKDGVLLRRLCRFWAFDFCVWFTLQMIPSEAITLQDGGCVPSVNR